jgi:hypothetical protein
MVFCESRIACPFACDWCATQGPGVRGEGVAAGGKAEGGLFPFCMNPEINFQRRRFERLSALSLPSLGC